MMKHFLLLAMVTLAACTTSSDLSTSKADVAFTVEGYSYNQVWDAVIQGLKDNYVGQGADIGKRLRISEENKATGVVIANSSASVFSWGELIGVYVEPPRDAPRHTVKIVTEGKAKYAIDSLHWTSWSHRVGNTISMHINETKK